MKENYKIITDEKKLLEFIDWLPDLKDGECYYLSLFARSKYIKDSGVKLSSDKQQLKRFTTTKEHLFNKIKQLEVEIGAYKLKEKQTNKENFDGLIKIGEPNKKFVDIPQETLALYITPNPRSYEKAGINLVKKLVDLVTKPYNGYNPHQEALNCIQTAKSRTMYFDFDFDNVSFEEIKNEILMCVNKESLNVVRTRGGFHLLVDMTKIEKQYAKSWYNNINKISGCDVRGDNLLPVVGCTQGAFTPEFINID